MIILKIYLLVIYILSLLVSLTSIVVSKSERERVTSMTNILMVAIPTIIFLLKH